MGELTEREIREKIATVQHWYHRIEVAPGITTPGINSSRECLELIPLPKDCSGLRALDIGARDGFYSFELERRGADVVAIDYIDPSITGFNVAKELLASKISCLVDNVYNLTRDRYGAFDIVLFLGTLYHLRDPLLALDRIWDVSADGAQLFVESQVIDNAFLDRDGNFVKLANLAPGLLHTPLMQFYPRDSLNQDFTNWWAPNMACLKALLESANFTVDYERLNGSRGIMTARKGDDESAGYYRKIEKSVITAQSG